jgi:hypothetical protein
MNPQDILNQNIRILIGDLQVNLMIANARVQELELQVAALTQALQGSPDPEVPGFKPNGRDTAPLPQ